MRREQSGHRDLAFNCWRRYAFGPEAKAFDRDLVAVCNMCAIPLVSYEATQAIGDKATVMLETHAKLTGAVPVLVRYEISGGEKCGKCGCPGPTELTRLFARVCGGDAIGDATDLVQFELDIRDKHHAAEHPGFPTWVYHPADSTRFRERLK